MDFFGALALDAESGQLLWQNRYTNPTSETDAAVAVDIERHRAFVGGFVHRIPGLGEEDLVLRTYDSQTGVIDWEDGFSGPNPGIDRCLCHPNDLVADKAVRLWSARKYSQPHWEYVDGARLRCRAWRPGVV